MALFFRTEKEKNIWKSLGEIREETVVKTREENKTRVITRVKTGEKTGVKTARKIISY